MEAPEPIKPQKRRRRWRQFSLSTLLVVVTILGVGLGVVTNRAERQRRAVAAIRAEGGTVRYDFEASSSPVVRGELPGPDWLCRMLGVDYFADVVEVRATGYVVKTGASGLQELWLRGTKVTDGGLAHLSGLTSLQALWLGGTQVTDGGLAHLTRLTSLQWLELSSTQVTDAGLVHLAGLTSLTQLYLHGTQVTDEGCDKLQQALPRCRIYR